MNKISGIYQIKNIQSGNIYVGSAVDISRRWRTHRRLLKKGTHHSSHLQNAWNKYGETSFAFIVVERCDKQDLLTKEQKYIDTWHPAYNTSLVAGSRLGVGQSEETKKIISNAMKGRVSVSWNKGKRGVYSDETIQKMSLARIGMIFSSEHRLNLSKSRKGKPSSWKGKTPSDESRKKMSEAHKGQIPWNKGRTTNQGGTV